MPSVDHALSCITPPHMLEKLLESDDNDIRQAALNTLLTTAQLRGERSIRASLAAAGSPANGRRTILDCENGTFLPLAVLARSEDGPASDDDSVNQAFDRFGATRQFYQDIYDRNSIDDRGMRLQGYVHRGVKDKNAFWDGQEMVFGDGDGKVFTDFASSLDVIAHELAHGVTEHSVRVRVPQPAWRFERVDVRRRGVAGQAVVTAADGRGRGLADWERGFHAYRIDADALRSMKAPGKAYDNQLLGTDPQPDHMSKFVHLPDTERGDNGGVHINSGIPNKAFYQVRWHWRVRVGRARTHLVRSSQGIDSDHPVPGVRRHYVPEGRGALPVRTVPEQQAVLAGWRDVGIGITGVPARGGLRRRAAPAGGGADLSALTKQIEALSAQVKELTKEVRGLKARK